VPRWLRVTLVQQQQRQCVLALVCIKRDENKQVTAEVALDWTGEQTHLALAAAALSLKWENCLQQRSRERQFRCPVNRIGRHHVS